MLRAPGRFFSTALKTAPRHPIRVCVRYCYASCSSLSSAPRSCFASTGPTWPIRLVRWHSATPIGPSSYRPRPSHPPHSARVLQASSFTVVLVSAASVAIVGVLSYYVQQSRSTFALDNDLDAKPILTESTDGMSVQIQVAPGRPGNLTPEQEEKLRQFWAAIFRIYGLVSADAADADEDDGADDATEASGPKDSKTKEKKKKRNIFRRSKKEAGGTDDNSSTLSKPATQTTALQDEDDKYGQGKVFQEALASMTPETIRATVWDMVKHDDPDALVLRFLRARKWDVEKALVMLVSTMHWRMKDMHVDDDIMLVGEGGAAEAVANGTDAGKVHQDFLAQLRMGKSFLHGFDKSGRPICVVRVRLHHQGEQVEESVERSTVYIIETARMLLRPPVDTATIIFDMTGFSLANMDYAPVKFMIKCFEANYPECLGAVLVHKAPWLFQGIWKIIRGWLDPVVAAKVHFTNNVKDLEQFIAKDQIMKELEGDEDWEYKYVEPEAGENAKMKDTATRDKLRSKRETLYRDYEAATLQWISTPDGEEGKAIKAKRADIAERLRATYWELDPYVRARSFYDRVGLLEPGGKINRKFNVPVDDTTQTPDPVANPPANGKAATDTTPSDVD